MLQAARSGEPDLSHGAMTDLAMRDRLLLAFADLRSFGIVAEPSVSGSITEATPEPGYAELLEALLDYAKSVDARRPAA
jgi:hypothetical protein